MNSSARGFTLLEIMVTVGIITILTAALIPGFTGYIDSQSLKQAQEQVKNDLRTAQNKALTNTQIAGQNVQSWAIQFTDSANSYNMLALSSFVCDSSVSTSPSEPLPEDATIRTSNGGTLCIYFDAVGNSNGGEVYVGSGNECRKVKVTQVGLITAEEAACP